MTREGKCDICRQRKVKCDEVHPSCGPCSKGGRSCSYNGQPNPSFRGFRPSPYQAERQDTGIQEDSDGTASSSEMGNALVLKSTTKAGLGGGRFRKFASVKSAHRRMPPLSQGQEHERMSFLSQPSSPELSLVSKWKAFAQVTNAGELHPYIFGEWQEILPPRLGHGRIIDLGVECFFQCTTAFVNPTERNIAKTCELNAKTIAAIRTALLGNKSRSIQDDILVATTYLKLVEAVMHSQSGNYKIHVRGAIDFLQQVSQKGAQCTDICKIMFYTSASHEFIAYVMRGEDSVFDSPAWLSASIPNIVDTTCPSPMFAQEYITKAQARLPRLVRLTRQARQSPEDQTARAAATELLTEVYANNLALWVQELRTVELVSPLPTTDPRLVPLLPTSFAFKSTRIYQRLIAYWELRCLTCGLVLALTNISPTVPFLSSFDVLEVADEEIQAAECIAMSMQYARMMATPFSMGIIWQLRPLMMSYGVWHRLERRAVTETESQRAAGMKSWTLDSMREITNKFKARENQPQELEYMHGILTGGPLPRGKDPQGK